MKTTWWKYFLLLGVLMFFRPYGSVAQQVPDSSSIDSLIYQLPAMMRSDENKARQMVQELATRSLQLQHHHGFIQSLFFRAWLSYRHDPAEVTIKSIDSALQQVRGINEDTALVKFYILRGQCYVKKTEFDKALESFSKALRIADKRGDTETGTGTLISIGWAYMEDGKPSEAIRFFSEVLRRNPAPDYDSRAVVLCNIAACYNTLGQYKKSEEYALQGIAVARKHQSSMDQANGLNILARSYYQQGKMTQAISYLKEAAVIREKVADPSMLASDYLELADLYSKNGQPQLAIAWAKKAEALSAGKEINLKLSGAYQTLASAYEATGDHKNAFIYLKKLLAQKDSLAEDRYRQALAEMQVQFETQKKTAENLRLKKENLEAKLQNSQQERWIVILSAVVVLIAASVIYISKLMKSRYRTRLALEQLQQQQERTLAVMETEEKERRRIAADLHDGVGQTLAAASLQLSKAQKGLQTLDQVDELISQACTEVRTLSHQVTPELLLHHGLVKAMERSVDRLNNSTDTTHFTLFTDIEVPADDIVASLTLYRCFQELCTNIIKHAQAKNVTVQLNLLAETWELLVEDDGVGFPVQEISQGLGFKNIKTRIALFEGDLVVDSTPGKGTTVIIRLLQPSLKKEALKIVQV